MHFESPNFFFGVKNLQKVILSILHTHFNHITYIYLNISFLFLSIEQ